MGSRPVAVRSQIRSNEAAHGAFHGLHGFAPQPQEISEPPGKQNHAKVRDGESTAYNDREGLSSGQSPRFRAGRKVRSPQGSVPVNGRGALLRRSVYGKCRRNYTAAAYGPR